MMLPLSKMSVRSTRLRNVALTLASVLMVQSPADVFAADAKSTDEPAKVTFEDDVKPILRQHCLNCHSQSDKRGGLALDSYGAMMEGGGSGEIVYDDGDAETSRLWQLVNHDDTPVMPPNQPKLPDDQLQVIRSWIEGGILENSGSKAKAKKKNALAFVASTSGRPEGPPPMPEALPQRVPVVTERAAATTAIGASPWAPLVALAGQKQISLYHTETAELLGVLPFEEGIPQSLRFSRDGQYLIAGGGEHSVKGIAAVYSIKTGERVAQVGDELDTVFDADVNDNMSRIALGGPQRMLRIFDATDGTQLFDIKKHTDWIYSVAYSPDGVLVASGDRSGGLFVWEAETGRLYLDLAGHKGAIRSIAWRDDSNVLASASEDGTVKLWDVNSGKAIRSINAGSGGVTAVQFDHKGQLVTAGKDRKVRLWDANGKQLTETPAASEAVLEVAITHDSSQMIYGDWTGSVRMSAVADPKKIQELAANPPPAKERIGAVEQTLASIKVKLTPLQEKRDATLAGLKAAEKAVSDMDAKIKQHNEAIAKSQTEIAAKKSLREKTVAALPTLVSKSRDAHDTVIASRIGLGDSPDDAALVQAADLEASLAEQLSNIAQQRRLIVQTKKDEAALAGALKAQQETLVAMQAQRTEMEKTVQTARVAADQAEQSYAAVAGELSEAEKKRQLLAEAIQ
ncbi:c-type cytochrome domain-containing protein [Rhodopirellula europaea]|jgi:predicted  nucleic acid-binding Zn-ribbon protein/mono/diheme cytochrome c family protein|uniref:Repeat-containing protein n=1 Tax=Rhodopirellula europaea SH398 TaxID=1263868 RepID=M5SJU8_9BACT|nr:c-type cytochrome domain-containing protein [Rhodopirellula europaea]EMI28012.1 repeat-containing protein [Rhodopirellula europaea SH398]